MNYLKLLITFLLGICTFTGIAQSSDHFTCHVSEEINPPVPPTEMNPLSINGQLTEPNGVLNCLIVYAGFEGYEGNPVDPGQLAFSVRNWTDDWRSDGGDTDYELPDYLVYDPNTGETTIDALLYTDPDILQPNIVDQSLNVSNILYLMSRPKREFKMVGKVFSDPEGIPRQVIIPADRFVEFGNTWGSVNGIVAEEMLNIWDSAPDDGDAYFAQFDNRENLPNYEESAPGPDGIVDMVIMIYRYSRGWDENNLPKTGMHGWSGSGGGIYGLPMGNANTPRFRHGLTIPKGNSGNRVFLHEFAHGLYTAPHLCGSNNVSGHHFNYNMAGMGLTAGSDNLSPTRTMMSSWERWYCGFIDPLEISEGQSTFLLGDYITTGDALRIEIPFSDINNGDRGVQHLWIQNHAGDHPLYDHRIAGLDLRHPQTPPTDDHIVANSDKGLYMYIEDMANTYEDFFSYSSRAGEILLINPMGNWDIERDTEIDPSRDIRSSKMYPFRYQEENPISGTNPWLRYRADLPNADGQTNGTITFRPSDWNGGARNEGDVIQREEVNGIFDHTYTWYGIGGGVRSSAFLAGDELNMGSNPTITNYPRYTNPTSSSNNPYYLTGLSVEIVNDGPQAQVKVAYKQTGVNNDVRWTGDIVLPDITDNNLYDLVLADNKQITLDLSRTPQRESINPVTGDFVNPTKLTISGDAGIHLKKPVESILINTLLY